MSSIPEHLSWVTPTSPQRGVAAGLRQPVNAQQREQADSLIGKIYIANVRNAVLANLSDIEYRGSDGEKDILRHVFRWDKAPYSFVFENGFRTNIATDVPYATSLSLEHYAIYPGRPIDIRKEATTRFISTTLSSAWFPTNQNTGHEECLYRYEIYAPGGILVAQTLGDRHRYPQAQDEVAFVIGIAPQYIRSAQCFGVVENSGIRCRRLDDNIYMNRNFNPQSCPPKLLAIQNPVGVYEDPGNRRSNLLIKPYASTTTITDRQLATAQGQLDTIDEVFEHYTVGVTGLHSYIDAAFRCKWWNKAYIFMKTEYVLIDYAPGSTGDRIINGPCYIGDSFPSLAGTAFAEYGIDAAFNYDNNTTEAMIFSGNLCAWIDYAPGSTNDRIIEGPKTIIQMFPFFKNNIFGKGIDAAFAAGQNAYLFKGNMYALIDYVHRKLIAIRLISDGFEVLRNSGFDEDIGAAFATHKKNEAYLFKGNKYILLHFTPGKMGDYIIGGPKDIVPGNWPSLSGLLPRKNIALDRLPQRNKEPTRRHQDYMFNS